MDKKTIPIIVVLAIVIIFYWPILEFLGLVKPDESAPVDRAAQDMVTVADSSAKPLPRPSEPTAYESAVEEQTSVELSPALDSVVVDTILIRTEKYQVMLSSLGGGPVSILLNEYTYRDSEPVEMLPEAESVTPEVRFAGETFSTSQLPFACNLAAGTYDVTSSPLDVIYTYTSPEGAIIERKLTFYPDRHHFDLTVNVPEPGRFGFERAYRLVWNTSLGPTEPDLKADFDAMQAAAMMGGSREKLDDFDDGVLNQTLMGNTEWAGLRSKYFAAVFIPRSRPAEAVFARGEKQKVALPEGSVDMRDITIGIEMPFAAMNPIADSFTVFVGPLDYMMMSDYGADLEDMLDIGTFPLIGWIIKPFAIGIMWLLPKMYNVVPNYGLVIILFALIIKIVTLPLSMKSFRSMQAMKEVQPKVEELKVKYKKDAQRLNQEMMKLYKAHGVNPLSGCLPLIPQMPLFFALFSVFRSTILLRDAPFVWFISDLSRGAQGISDPYIILVVLMVGAQFLSQKMTMASTQQNKALMYVMPLFMGFLFYRFSAGLVLYWTSFSVLSLLDYLTFKRNPKVKPEEK